MGFIRRGNYEYNTIEGIVDTVKVYNYSGGVLWLFQREKKEYLK